MARNDEGEFELVLGNRQLVSVFLIVVILLGAFFSMGYLVGRSTSAPGTTEASNRAPDRKPVTDPASSDQSAGQMPDLVPDRKPGSPIQPAAPVDASNDQTKPEAIKPSPLSEKPKHEMPAETPAEKPAEKPVEKPSPSAAPSAEPRSGQTFFQVVATSRSDAEIVSESLGKKGFHTTLAPVPDKPGLFRVLVGPVGGGAELTEMRVRLESVGFKPIVRKY